MKFPLTFNCFQGFSMVDPSHQAGMPPYTTQMKSASLGCPPKDTPNPDGSASDARLTTHNKGTRTHNTQKRTTVSQFPPGRFSLRLPSNSLSGMFWYPYPRPPQTHLGLCPDPAWTPIILYEKPFPMETVVWMAFVIKVLGRQRWVNLPKLDAQPT